MNVVVGAASGMGEATAVRLAKRGPLVVADKDGGAAAALAQRLGDDAVAVTCDVTSEADVAALASLVGTTEALVVTAGLSPTMASGRRIFDVNLRGMALLLEGLDATVRPGSAAVCFASIAAHGPLPPAERLAALDDPLSPQFFERLEQAGVDLEQSGHAYSLSKLGVVRLVRRLAPSWGRRGARIVSLSPGIIDTPMGQLESANQPVMAQMVAGTPLGRTARADEVAAVADFLCSPEASFVTGCDVLVDGGWSVGLPSGS